MQIRRGWILAGAAFFQVLSWWDVKGAVGRLLHISEVPMTPMQTAQLVASSVLLLLFVAIKPEKSDRSSVS